MISLKNLTKNYGSKLAVDNLSLEIEKGELFAFLGPNAAGKTTTIKMITGLLQPTSGEIHVAGMSLKENVDKVKKYISYIPDFPYLYEKLTPYEMFSFFQDIYEMDKKTSMGRIDELLELFDLLEYRDILIENLSHGIKQRVVIGSGKNVHTLDGQVFRGIIFVTAKAKGGPVRHRVIINGPETPFQFKVAKKPYDVVLNEAGEMLALDIRTR